MRFINLSFVFCSVLLFSISYKALAKPLVLQYEVSHSRNTDQISLIFLEDKVKLVVNTSSWQKGKKARLGEFRSPLTPKLSDIKKRLESTYTYLKKHVSMASLVSLPPPHPVPHAPVLQLKDQELKYMHPQFNSLAKIIYSVWEVAKWTCIDCATYKKRRNTILRKVTIQSKGQKKVAVRSQSLKKQKKMTVKSSKEKQKTPLTYNTQFSIKQLSCRLKSSKTLECVDPQYGIFEL